MIHIIIALVVAWLMINVSLFVAMNRADAVALCHRIIDRFLDAVFG